MESASIDLQLSSGFSFYGNAYGGFYICDSLLNDQSIVYSVGVGEDISFDLEVIRRHQCHVFAFDPTPRSIHWVEAQDLPGQFHFHDYGVLAKSGEHDLFLPRNPAYVSGSVHKHDQVAASIKVQFRTLEEILKEQQHTRIDVLKLDIEGAEYDVLESLSDNLNIKQILVEFHDRFYPNQPKKSRSTIDLLRNKGFKIFAVSESGNEVSFIHGEG